MDHRQGQRMDRRRAIEREESGVAFAADQDFVGHEADPSRRALSLRLRSLLRTNGFLGYNKLRSP